MVSLLKEPSVLVLGPKPESKLDCLLLASVGSKESSSKPAKQKIFCFITIVLSLFNPIWRDLKSYVKNGCDTFISFKILEVQKQTVPPMDMKLLWGRKAHFL